MANHIQNYIHILNADENVLNEVKRIFEREEGKYDVQTEQLAQRVYGDETPLEYDRGWYETKCGAKWLYGRIEDDYIEDIVVDITSAWDAINPWVERFAENLRKIKSDVVVHNTYEDEAYNFAGVYYTSEEYDDNEEVDMNEYDVDEIFEDDNVREDYHNELIEILQMHINCHSEAIEDLKNE